MTKMIDYTILLCGIIKDAEHSLRNNIPIINDMLSHFKDWKVIIFENDSTDNTKLILQEWRETQTDRIVILSDSIDNITIPVSLTKDGVNPFFSCKRIAKMVHLRNRYMEYIEEANLSADYLMVVDLDVVAFNSKDILRCFTQPEKWDVVTANGWSRGPNLLKRYHDTYAFTSLSNDVKTQTEKDIYLTGRHLWKKLTKNRDEYLEVFSAFGGIAIYKFKLIKGLKYQLEYNNDDRVEVRCEHYTLHKQIKEREKVHIMIDPKLKVKYQSVTTKIIISKLLNYFK